MKAKPRAAKRLRRRAALIEGLPRANDVREEVRQTSHRMRVLLDLLGVCEKAEHVTSSRSSKCRST